MSDNGYKKAGESSTWQQRYANKLVAARQAAATLSDRMRVHAALRAIAVREGELARTLAALIPEAAQCAVPLFAADIHDLSGLGVLAELLGRSEDAPAAAD